MTDLSGGFIPFCDQLVFHTFFPIVLDTTITHTHTHTQPAHAASDQHSTRQYVAAAAAHEHYCCRLRSIYMSHTTSHLFTPAHTTSGVQQGCGQFGYTQFIHTQFGWSSAISKHTHTHSFPALRTRTARPHLFLNLKFRLSHS